MMSDQVRMPTRQLVITLTALCGVLLVAYPASQLVLLGSPRPLGTRIADGVAFGGTQAVMCSILSVAAWRHQHVHLDVYGITVIRLFRRPRFIPWNDVWSVEPRSVLGVQTLRVRTRWAPMSLPVPHNAWWAPNRQFDADVARVLAWWHHCRTVWPPPPADPATRARAQD
jgi:hypothetical protein